MSAPLRSPAVLAFTRSVENGTKSGLSRPVHTLRYPESPPNLVGNFLERDVGFDCLGWGDTGGFGG